MFLHFLTLNPSLPPVSALLGERLATSDCIICRYLWYFRSVCFVSVHTTKPNLPLFALFPLTWRCLRSRHQAEFVAIYTVPAHVALFALRRPS